MAIATMARMMKKTIKMTAMTMFRFVIFLGEVGGGKRGGGRRGVGGRRTRRSGGERRGD